MIALSKYVDILLIIVTIIQLIFNRLTYREEIFLLEWTKNSDTRIIETLNKLSIIIVYAVRIAYSDPKKLSKVLNACKIKIMDKLVKCKSIMIY